jgi:outer membrane immunogenic protein
MKKLVVALASLAAFTGSAVAADMAVKAPPPLPPAPVYSWTGCYLGGGGGFGLFKADHSQIATSTPQQTNAFPLGTVTASNQSAGGSGYLGIVGGGCDYQFAPTILGGNFVVGGFADYTWSNINGDTVTFGHNFLDGSAEVGVGNLKNSSSWAVGGRIGYVIPSLPQLLTYVNAGWSEARFDGVGFTSNLAPFIGTNTGLALPSNTYKGWFIGGGTEYGFNWLPGMFLRTEYRYYSYDNATINTVCTGASAPGPVASCVTAGPSGFGDHYSPHVQSIFTELVYRFNWGGPPINARY